MVNIVPYIKIIRPVNAGLTACAVLLGMWLTSIGRLDPLAAALLMIASAAAAAYGNVINDILDVESDRVSHPNRPIAGGVMTVKAASVYAVALVVVSLVCAACVSAFHATAALLPIALLTFYSIHFKRTRVAGNVVVATLTAYALLYGSLTRPNINILIVPACLAFLLNFCREIVKDVQDAAGDRQAGWRTSADLSRGVIRALLLVAGGIYTAAVLAPSLELGHFGMGYTVTCLALVLPIHIYWMALAARPDIGRFAGRIGAVLKLEMIAGLLALALDKIFF